MKCGFAEIEITPQLGTKKIGWMEDLSANIINDPLYARVAVFDNNETRIAFIQLDLLCILSTQVDNIRNRIAEKYDFVGQNIMVCATHNHAGPAVIDSYPVSCDYEYVEMMMQRVTTVFGAALANLQDAAIGFGHGFEWRVGSNRRRVMRDGTVKTNFNLLDPDVLFVEGPMDPEVAVLAVRSNAGKLLGCLVNFACHPTHFGGDDTISAGFPGVLAAEMKKNNCPVTLFLNGAAGNINTINSQTGEWVEMEYAGKCLAEDVNKVINGMCYRENVKLISKSTQLHLPFRKPTEAEIKGTVKGAQRFRSDDLYAILINKVLERINRMGTNLTEVQVLAIDEICFAGVSAEYFVEFGLHIKEHVYPKRALVVGYSNGMVGYVPTIDAFKRGGYETTFMTFSELSPEAGDVLATAAINLINSLGSNNLE